MQADVAELADASDLKSDGITSRTGSSPVIGTTEDGEPPRGLAVLCRTVACSTGRVCLQTPNSRHPIKPAFHKAGRELAGSARSIARVEPGTAPCGRNEDVRMLANEVTRCAR